MKINLTLVAITLAISGCENNVVREPGVRFYSDEVAEVFRAELKKNNISFNTSVNNKGEEFFYWDKSDDTYIRSIENNLLRRKPPETSLKVNGINAEIIKDIKELAISYEEITYSDGRYIVWREEDDEKVDALKKNSVEAAQDEYKQFLSQIKKEATNYKSVPEWSVDTKKELPLPISDALFITKSWAKVRWPNSNGSTVRAINIKQVLRTNEGEWWNYAVTISPNSITIGDPESLGAEVVIKMDGSIHGYQIIGAKEYIEVKQSSGQK